MKRLPLARFLRSTEITYETQPGEADQAQLFHSGRYRSGGGTYARGETELVCAPNAALQTE